MRHLKKRILTLGLSLVLVTQAFGFSVEHSFAKTQTLRTTPQTYIATNGTSFRQALNDAADGDVIQIDGSVQVSDSNNQDNVFVINKSITIIGNKTTPSSLTLREAGIIIGKDVTFENLTLELPNLVRNAIFANGHKLTLKNINLESGRAKGDVFCGSITDYTAVSYTHLEKTISQYLGALDRIFVTENLPAWNPALRSKTAIRTSPKRQFVDPSIAAAVLRLTPSGLLEDFNYFGFLFESLCDRDLRIYAEAIDGQVFHYRDASGLEADAVIALNDGRWAAVEVKLGSKEIEDAAVHLLELKNKVNTEKMREPSFLMILTGSEIAYRREDGVYVVPLGLSLIHI